jgi:fructose-1,6-bisphosphatase/inositol monophosphatase family enzyme
MTFTNRDLATLAGLLREAARAEVMPRFRRLDAGSIRAKSGPLDLVTVADEAAEHAITAGLRRAFPGCLVVGEEAASADPSVMATLGTADLAFVVDPIDGTSNYAAGIPLFGVMAAAIMQGEVVAAAILDPVADDMALALRGEGAWSEGPDGGTRDLRVARPAPVGEMNGHISWRYLPEAERSAVCANLPRLAGAWDFRCAAHQYRMVASGSTHLLMFNRLLPWDHAPGWLLHREAGGYAARYDGSPYLPVHQSGGIICAPDKASWHAVRAALLPAYASALA